jgi:hypothetical protein
VAIKTIGKGRLLKYLRGILREEKIAKKESEAEVFGFWSNEYYAGRIEIIEELIMGIKNEVIPDEE